MKKITMKAALAKAQKLAGGDGAMNATHTKSISVPSRMSKSEIIATVEHALMIAREAPHRANGGVVADIFTSADVDRKERENTHAAERRQLWSEVFFGVVSRESYDSHQPG